MFTMMRKILLSNALHAQLWFVSTGYTIRGWHTALFTYLHSLLYARIQGVSEQMEWLLELMGHIRNIAYGGKSETCGDTSAVSH